MTRLAKKAVKRGVEAVPIPALCRRLAEGRLSRLPVVLCFDVEPDEREVDRDEPGRWVGFEQTVPRIAVLRDELARITGRPAAFSWFLRMDVQVEEAWGSAAWAVETYRQELDRLESEGDDLGLHTHTWRREGERWVTDYDPSWAHRCLTRTLDAFEAAFGRRCRAHRGGDRALAGSTVALLGERGVTVDLTAEPGTPPLGAIVPGEISRGLSPDYRHVPTAPYRSSPAAFPAPDASDPSGPLLVPLTTHRVRRGRRTLYLTAHPTLFALRLLAELILGSSPVLAFAMRTDDDLMGAWAPLAQNARHLARHRGARFVTAGAIADSGRSRLPLAGVAA